jgi:hypothetical protein
MKFNKNQKHAQNATKTSLIITVIFAHFMIIKLNKRKFFIAINVVFVELVERRTNSTVINASVVYV